jgi:hypothetical protein
MTHCPSKVNKVQKRCYGLLKQTPYHPTRFWKKIYLISYLPQTKLQKQYTVYVYSYLWSALCQ